MCHRTKESSTNGRLRTPPVTSASWRNVRRSTLVRNTRIGRGAFPSSGCTETNDPSNLLSSAPRTNVPPPMPNATQTATINVKIRLSRTLLSQCELHVASRAGFKNGTMVCVALTAKPRTVIP